LWGHGSVRDARGRAEHADASAPGADGHRDFNTTLIYADYAPSEREAEWVEQAFRPVAPDVIDATVSI
jgi:hypothetical protein